MIWASELFSKKPVKGLIKGLEKNQQVTPEMKEKLKQMQVTTWQEAEADINDLKMLYAQL